MTNVVADFGGLAELQRMEHRYNGVTFGHYTDVWKQAALSQFKGAKLWITLFFFGIIVYLFTMTPLVHGSQLTGLNWGLLGGIILVNVVTAGKQYSKYFKLLYRYGFHNPPTEIQYTLTRVMGTGVLLYILGVIGLQLAAVWPLLLHPIIIAACMTVNVVYANSYGILNRHLYNIEPSIWS